MNKEIKKNLVFLLLFLIYQYFFWQEKLGLNLILFQGLLLSALYWLDPRVWQKRSVMALACLSSWTALAVFFQNSFIARFAYFTCSLLFMGIFQETRIRSVSYLIAFAGHHLLHSLWKFMIFPLEWLSNRLEALPKHRKFHSYLRVSVIPFSIFMIFYLLFWAANPVFQKINFSILHNLAYLMDSIYSQFSAFKFFFLLMGAYFLFSWLNRWDINALVSWEAKEKEVILRKRKAKLFSHTMIGLKSEYRAGIILGYLVNGLLLVINLIDFNFLWIRFDFHSVENFKDLVHQGTYILIFNILLAMGIMIFYFRANINFIPGNEKLKRLCYLWIIQNGLLCFSVALRTYYYILQNGMAYKRLGVFIFLILTLYGLFTLFRKIQGKKTLYYLIRQNSRAALLMLVLMAWLNWDLMIVRYNLAHIQQNGRGDLEFLFNRSDNTLRILEANRKKFLSNSPLIQKKWEQQYQSLLDRRCRNYLRNQETYTWLSWNFQDRQTISYLKSRKTRGLAEINPKSKD